MEPQNTQNTGKSEIALFLQQWDAEADAIRLALHGYAITARHDFISKRMQAFGDAKMVELMALEAKKTNEANREQNNMSSDENTVNREHGGADSES